MKIITRIFLRYFFLAALLAAPVLIFAQQRPLLRSSTPVQPPKAAITDTVKTDTVALKPRSSNGLDSEVKYSAEDSIRFDRKHNMVYLYGKGRIAYEDFELDADYIRLDQKNNLVFATGIKDPKTNRYRGRPILKQGPEPPAYTDSLVFNFQTKKGKTYGISTEVEGGYLQAAQFKKNQYDEGFFKNGIYSTCNLPHPHFGIHILKGMVTEKQIITGPAYLEIEDIPFPAAIPFGFFPKTNRRASGILFPTFGEDAARGFYMQDLGYYIGLNDYWDAELRGSLYSKGSYQGSVLGRYRRNYKYDGSLNFRYASTRLGVEGTPEYKPQKDFNVQWTHSQRTEANPGTTFSASVNFGTSSFYATTAAAGTYDINQLTRNNASSSISYGKTFGDLFNLTSSLSHSQDFSTKNISLLLPDVSLTMTSLSPFDRKDRVGEQKWYQKLTVGYSMRASNSIDTKEYLLFKPGSLNKFQNGMQHSIPISLSLNAFKYFQFNSSVNYTESWYLQTIRKQYMPLTRELTVDTVSGFSRAYDYGFSTGLTTKIYGIKNFKKGNLLAIRHVITPSISLNYHPDFSQSKYGFYRDIEIDPAIVNPPSQRELRYSIFEGGKFGGPGAGRSGSVGFSVDNNIEAKVKSKSDTSSTPEKIPIIQGLSFNGSYNLAADEYRLSTISFGGRTSFFKQKFGVNFYGTFDPYQIDSLGRRVNRYLIRDGKLARLANFGLSFDFSFNSEAAKNRNQKLQQANGTVNRANLSPQQNDELSRISRDPNAFVDFNVPWNLSASYSFNYSNTGLISTINNTLNFYGDFSVTPKWKVQYTSGYDFHTNKISLTQFSIYRDLHCWDLSIRWVPFGTYQSYSVDLRVKASILQDLKLSRRRDYYNNF